jgi:hypothetical protein
VTDFDFGFSDVNEAEFTKETPVEFTETIDNDKLDYMLEVLDRVEKENQALNDRLDRILDSNVNNSELVLSKITQMRDLIMPLLIKLRDSESEYIQWPIDIRKRVINEQISKIENVINS